MKETMRVEILTFEGCPNARSATELVERIVGELRRDAVIERIDVPGPRDAERLRFLGSPTIRIDGRDVEPGADERTDYVLACRVYRTSDGFSGLPDERWLRDTIVRAR